MNTAAKFGIYTFCGIKNYENILHNSDERTVHDTTGSANYGVIKMYCLLWLKIQDRRVNATSVLI